VRQISFGSLRFVICTVALAGALLLPIRAAGQQFVTDDAARVDRGACQVEVWHGEVSSWLLPACHLVPGVELTAGLGWVRENGERSTENVLQAKSVFRPLGPNRLAVGLVAGLGLDPVEQSRTGTVSSAFAFVPVSYSPRGDDLLLHMNVGLHLHRREDGQEELSRRSDLTWAVRGDVPLGGAVTGIAELYGFEGERPLYQLGLRTAVIEELLGIDVSWGGNTRSGEAGAGWVVGLAWTPAPFR
jgi:hypothetical protein